MRKAQVNEYASDDYLLKTDGRIFTRKLLKTFHYQKAYELETSQRTDPEEVRDWNLWQNSTMHLPENRYGKIARESILLRESVQNKEIAESMKTSWKQACVRFLNF